MANVRMIYLLLFFVMMFCVFHRLNSQESNHNQMEVENFRNYWKNSLSQSEKKIDWNLLKMFKTLDPNVQYQDNYKQVYEALKKNIPKGITIDHEERILCKIWLEDDLIYPDLISYMGKSNIKVLNDRSEYKYFIAYIPIKLISKIAEFRNVDFISPALPYSTSTGMITSEGDNILKADISRNKFNVLGDGVRIGVISDCVNPNYQPITSNSDLGIGANEVPTVVTSDSELNQSGPQLYVLQNNQYGNNDKAEGLAMLEIIHDLCPNADLLFCSALINNDFLATSISLLANAGCDIIVDDVFGYDQPYFEDNSGVSAPILNEINSFTQGGGIYLTASGNSADRHYEAPFDDVDNNGIHNYSASDEQLDFEIKSGGSITVFIQWSNAWGDATTDLDAELWEKDIIGDDLVASDYTVNLNHNPFIYLYYENNGITDAEIYLRILNAYGPTNIHLEIYWQLDGSGLFETSNLTDTQFLVKEGSSFGHSVFENSVSIGTINALDENFNNNFPYDLLAAYSSHGPCKIFYDMTNQLYEERIKPDITAIDGIHISGAFGFGRDDGPSTPGNVFFGTSAAAPHAAAISGLIKSGSLSLNNREITSILQNTSIQFGAYTYSSLTGMSDETGHGRIDAYNALRIGRKENQSYAYTDKFISCYVHPDVSDGGRNPDSTKEDVQSLLGFEKQEFENGTIVYQPGNANAYWLGEGIWNYWSYDLNALNSTPIIGYPISNEYLDAGNNNYPTVDFDNGKIYWDGNQASAKWIIANFSADPTSGNVPVTIQFTDLSTLHNSVSPVYEWDFNNDGTIDSYEQSPTRFFGTPGTYTVKLTVSDATLSSTETKVNYITIGDEILPNTAQIEYFFDSDPGFGNGIAIPFTAANEVTVQTTIDVSALSIGLHRLYIRAKDENGNWGIPQAKTVLIQATDPNDPLPNVSQVEYFFDSDPGQGGGSSFTITSGTTVNISDNIDLSGMPIGLHRLYVRARDENGEWGIPQSRSLLVQATDPNDPLPNVSQVEYFFDADPGQGSGSSFSIAPGTTVNISDNIDLSGMPIGLHRLYVRAKDENENWGIPQSRSVLVQATDPNDLLPNVSQVEYFFDSDPGQGSGASFNITPGTSVDISDNIDLTGVQTGLHRFYVRAKDETERWGIPQSGIVLVQKSSPSDPLPNITKVEYFFDSDPGMGSGTSLPLTPDDTVEISTNLPLNVLSPGDHNLYVRAQDANNFWGIPQYHTFSIVEAIVYTDVEAASLGMLISFNEGGTDPGDGHHVDMTFISLTGSGNVTVQQTNQTSANLYNNVSLDYTWDITHDPTITAFTAEVTFHYQDFDLTGLTESDLVAAYYDSSQMEWPVLPDYTVDELSNTLTIHNLDHFTVFAIGEPSAFINLGTIGTVNVDLDSADVILSWHSVPGAEEYNIYRSTVPYFTPSAAYAAVTDTYYVDVSAAIADTADYFYRVTAVSGVLETAASSEIGKSDFTLLPGWNLISLPILSSETSIDSVIGSQLTGGANVATSDVIYYYDGGAYQSAWYHEATQKWFGTLTDIEPDKGYWVKILSGHTDTLLTFVGSISDTSRKIDIVPGWNMVGSAYPVDVPLSESNLAGSGFTGASTPAQSDKTYEYSDGVYSNAWLYAPTSAWFGTLTNLKPGKGYWIWVLDGHSGFIWDYTRQLPAVLAGGGKPKLMAQNDPKDQIDSKPEKAKIGKNNRLGKSLVADKSQESIE